MHDQNTALLLLAFAATVPAAVGECVCKATWSTFDTDECKSDQFGCPLDVACDGDDPWCMAVKDDDGPHNCTLCGEEECTTGAAPWFYCAKHDCADCATGRSRPPGCSESGNETCEVDADCPLAHWCPGDGIAHPCPVGTHGREDGVRGKTTEADACPGHCEPGNFTRHSRNGTTGVVSKEDLACDICLADHFCPGDGMAHPCLCGTKSFAGATSSGECFLEGNNCTAGTYFVPHKNECVGCAPNMYATGSGNTECAPCPSGSFVIDSSEHCEPCPKKGGGVECTDGLARIKPGKWFATNSTIPKITNITENTKFYDCLGPETCDVIRPDNTAFYCNEGHRGVLCGECDEEYTRSKNKCIKCPEVYASALSVAAVFLFFYGVLVYCAMHTDGEENKSSTTVLWRIFISYFTVASTIGDFPVRGTKVFQAYTDFLTTLPKIVDYGFVPVLCQTQDAFWFAFVAKAGLPFFIAAVVPWGIDGALWVCKRVGYCGRSPKDTKLGYQISMDERYKAAKVYVAYYLFPSMVDHLLRIFHCTENIEGHGYDGKTSYLVGELSISCDSETTKIAQGLAFIVIVFYITQYMYFVWRTTVHDSDKCFGNPYKRIPRDPAFCAQYGFLFVGYRREAAWWEIAVITRKIALVFVLVFLDQNKFLQSIWTLFVLFVATAAQLNWKPFEKPSMNRMEAFGLYTLLFTQLISIAYYWIEQDSTKDDDEKASITTATTVLLLAINIDTIVVLLGYIATRRTLKGWYLWLCNCCEDDVDKGPETKSEKKWLFPPIPGLETLRVLAWQAWDLGPYARRKRREKYMRLLRLKVMGRRWVHRARQKIAHRRNSIEMRNAWALATESPWSARKSPQTKERHKTKGRQEPPRRVLPAAPGPTSRRTGVRPLPRSVTLAVVRSNSASRMANNGTAVAVDLD